MADTRVAAAPAPLRAPARRAPLYADFLLEEAIVEPPEPRFKNLRWAAWQLARVFLVAIAIGLPIAALWHRP